MDSDNSIFVAYASIIGMALWPIWIGAHRSLKYHGLRVKNNSVAFRQDTEKKAEDVMNHKDAYMFPIYGSGTLFGLYVLIKIFSKEWVNLLLTVYFVGLGVFAVGSTVAPWIGPVLPGSFRKRKFDWSVNLPFAGHQELIFHGQDLLGAVVGLAVAAWYLSTKHWISNNVLGLAFSVQGVERMPIGTYGIGCILLSGLFFYDIFWVFGTDVMVSVAKGLDAPIKLLFPKDILAAEYQFSMLGLGDIVIPGLFLALLLRYDAHRAYRTKQSFSETYFRTTFLAYILGLATTIFVMHFFKAAQPALLYLVPACIGSSFLLALAKQDLSGLMAYTDDDPSGEKKLKEKEKKDDSKPEDKKKQ